jgi:hypothetical protein
VVTHNARRKDTVVQGIFIDVACRYVADALAEDGSDDLVAMSIVYECLYGTLRLHGPTNMRLGAERSRLDPTVGHLYIHVALGVTGVADRDLPSVEAIAHAVTLQVANGQAQPPRYIAETVRVSYATLAGMWQIYDAPPPAALASVEASLLA